MQAILNGLNFEVNIPSGVDVDNVAVHYFSDSYYDPTDALDCGGSGLEDASPNEMPALPQIQDAINTIEEDSKAFDIQVSPNPATTNFNLSYDLPEAHNVSIQLLDMQGRVVREVTRNTMQEAGLQNRTCRRSYANA